MLRPEDEEHLDQVMTRFATLLHRVQKQQARIDERLTLLYQIGFIAFGVLVASVSFLSIILSQQVPGVADAIARINHSFAEVANDMVRIEDAVQALGEPLQSMPQIVKEVDHMQHSVSIMADDVTAMTARMQRIDQHVAHLHLTAQDMTQSFIQMDHQVAAMGYEVNRLSQPMRMFNWMTPWR